jgi:D-alanyl-D-alanine carboxypeptidase
MRQFNIVVFGGLFVIFFLIISIRGFNLIFSDFRIGSVFETVQNIGKVGIRLVSNAFSSSDISFGEKKYVMPEEDIDFLSPDKNMNPGNMEISAQKTNDKDITAKSYIMKSLEDNKTIVSNNEDRSFPIASLTKLVTAVVARKNIDQDKKIEIDKKILATYGNNAQFRFGETYKASDLLYPLLLISSNDASEALARAYGRAKFIKAMNDFVQEVGAYHTYFFDPSGISPDNISTANDMSLIVEWIMKNDPQIFSITSLKSKSVRNHTWVNPSHFLNYSNYIGGKNGYIPEARLTTVSLFRLGKDNKPYVIVLLNGTNRDKDILSLMHKVD